MTGKIGPQEIIFRIFWKISGRHVSDAEFMNHQVLVFKLDYQVVLC